MNFRLVFKVTGKTLLLEAAAMILPMLVGLIYGEPALPFLWSILITAAVGGALSLLKSDTKLFAREGYFTVGLIWVLFGVFGALPFYFSGYFGSYIDCLFVTQPGTDHQLIDSITQMGKTQAADSVDDPLFGIQVKIIHNQSSPFFGNINMIIADFSL